jgi:hypothetical protein
MDTELDTNDSVGTRKIYSALPVEQVAREMQYALIYFDSPPSFPSAKFNRSILTQEWYLYRRKERLLSMFIKNTCLESKFYLW